MRGGVGAIEVIVALLVLAALTWFIVQMAIHLTNRPRRDRSTPDWSERTWGHLAGWLAKQERRQQAEEDATASWEAHTERVVDTGEHVVVVRLRTTGNPSRVLKRVELNRFPLDVDTLELAQAQGVAQDRAWQYNEADAR